MVWGCSVILGLLGGSSCIHTNIEFEPSIKGGDFKVPPKAASNLFSRYKYPVPQSVNSL